MIGKALDSDDVSPSVLLLSMPWTNLNQPNLGLGILKSILNQADIDCKIRHLNLELLQLLKGTTYFVLSNTFALNDFMFSRMLDSHLSHLQMRVLRELASETFASPHIDSCEIGSLELFIERLLEVRNEQIPNWLETVAEDIANADYTLVGFSCMFDQTIASLALAKLIKQKAPEKVIVFGGYAVRSPTAQSIMKAFPFVDGICLGEGEASIVELAHASIHSDMMHDVPGLLLRDQSGDLIETPPDPQWDMDDIPAPDYADFYADIEMMSDVHQVDVEVVSLALENSRGCWWGQKKHCIFCGIKSQDLVYRFKSAERALAQMHQMHKQYGETKFRFADYILPNDYYTSLMPLLADDGAPYQLETEIKANVSPQKFAHLIEAGFVGVQPGIESFSTAVLQQMNKGVHATQNVYLMRRGKEEAVQIQYNIIYGFPNERQEDYKEMARQLPRLVHLDPPITYVPAQITRYAPLHMAPEMFGIPEAVYHSDYDVIFSQKFISQTGFDLNEFCYFFERPFENAPHLEKLYGQMEGIISQWRVAYHNQTAQLQWIEDEREGVIVDSRLSEQSMLHLSPLECSLLKYMEEPIGLSQLKNRFLNICEECDWADAYSRLDKLGLFFIDDHKVVSLPLKKEAKLYSHEKVVQNHHEAGEPKDQSLHH